jgi:transmembrane protein 222
MKSYLEQDDDGVIDIAKNRFPYCLVWTPLPLITWFFPFIGHTGICTSEGIIHDFSGDFSITINDMAFSDPTKYVKLDIPDKEAWNACILQADSKFKKTRHSLLSNNCHSHCAYALNQAHFQSGGWNIFWIIYLLVTKSKYTTWKAFFQTYFGFFLLFSLIFLLTFAINL